SRGQKSRGAINSDMAPKGRPFLFGAAGHTSRRSAAARAAGVQQVRLQSIHTQEKTRMTIKAGDRIPSVSLRKMTADGPAVTSTDEFFGGKKVVLFAVPGAFTPTCSVRHLPGFVEKAEAFKAKGIDTVACVAVNDVFVMDAWGKSQNAADKVEMLSDG